MLAYYAILINERPISERRLRRRCERILREAIEVEVDFRVNRAVKRLCEMDRIDEDSEGTWRVTPSVN